MNGNPELSVCDFVIRSATVIDGTAQAAFVADVAIKGDKILAVGNLPEITAREELNAAGLCVSPGFIDSHAHDDYAVLADSAMSAKVSQGVTTVIVGQCGLSLTPFKVSGPLSPIFEMCWPASGYRFPTFKTYADALQRNASAVNVAALIGHTTLRAGAMSDLRRPATEPELGVMMELLEEALNEGAMGLSSGLFYSPASAALSAEVARLVMMCGVADGIYTAHMRDEGDGILEAIDETMDIGSRAGTKVVISHLKCLGKANFCRAEEVLSHLDAVENRKLIAWDAYPYTAGSTTLDHRLVDQSSRVIITWSGPCPDCAGKDLEMIATEMGCSRTEACRRLAPANAIFFMMHETDVERILTHPNTMIGSDGNPFDRHPHPRLWGTFTRFLAYFVRERSMLPITEAVWRMSGLPAKVYGPSLSR